MKKIMDSNKTLVRDMIQGYVKAYPERVRLLGDNILLRAREKDISKTAVLIGNGSGHEPAMIDLVGEGLFDANVCGKIFAAPSPMEMMDALKEISKNGREEILILVSSHAGDILNAKMTLMLAKAEGINADMVVLWDDISSAPKGMEQERRGTAGLFFTYKVVCSAAEDEIEVGMGVHGEAGTGRMKLPTAKELTEYMLEQILADKPFVAGDKIGVLVNNAGSMTRMELMIIYKHVARIMEEKGIEIVRNWVGTYVTTQEMAGFSIAVCKMDDEILKYYDYKVDSPLF